MPANVDDRFNPFSKSIGSLSATDLVVLRDVAEGWYVEYKSELPTGRSLSKTISAFANTYGGYLFLGISEESKGTPTAGRFVGIETSEVEVALQRIRQSVASSISPPPHFDVAVLQGPCDEIGLLSERSVVVVHIPWSPNTPHIHSSGQIFRRVGEGSEPMPETSRYELDQLWSRSKERRRLIRKWVKHKPSFSQAERSQPYLRLLLSADIWGHTQEPFKPSLSTFRELVNTEPYYIPFDFVHEHHNGYVCRQVMTNDPNIFGLYMRVTQWMNLEIIIPLHYLDADRFETVIEWLDGYENGQNFVHALAAKSYTNIRLIDLNMVFGLLLSTAHTYHRLLDAAGRGRSYKAKAILLNSERYIPFIDSAQYTADCRSFGFPWITSDEVISPPGPDPEAFLDVMTTDPSSDVPPGVIESISMFGLVESAFGLQTFVGFDGTSEQKNAHYSSVLSSGATAEKVQSRRTRGK